MLKSTKLKNTLLVGATAILVSCGGQKEIKMGSYAYDAQFLKDHGIEYTELVSADGNSKVMVIPAWQGRVMTTSASGDEGDSYGWINYRFINEGKVSSQFNPVGGEERFWLGPEGGPFSLYFRFSSVRLNRLRNKLLANYLKSGGNELATVRISAFCVAMLSNNSFICKYSIFFRKYELSAAVL